MTVVTVAMDYSPRTEKAFGRYALPLVGDNVRKISFQVMKLKISTGDIVKHYRDVKL